MFDPRNSVVGKFLDGEYVLHRLKVITILSTNCPLLISSTSIETSSAVNPPQTIIGLSDASPSVLHRCSLQPGWSASDERCRHGQGPIIDPAMILIEWRISARESRLIQLPRIGLKCCPFHDSRTQVSIMASFHDSNGIFLSA